MFRPCGHNHCPLEGKHTKLLNKSLNGNCLQTSALQTYITKWQQTPNPLVNYPIWHFSIDSYSPIKTCTFVPCFLLRVIFSITYLINNVKALRPENGHVSVLRREINDFHLTGTEKGCQAGRDNGDKSPPGFLHIRSPEMTARKALFLFMVIWLLTKA